MCGVPYDCRYRSAASHCVHVTPPSLLHRLIPGASEDGSATASDARRYRRPSSCVATWYPILRRFEPDGVFVLTTWMTPSSPLPHARSIVLHASRRCFSGSKRREAPAAVPPRPAVWLPPPKTSAQSSPLLRWSRGLAWMFLSIHRSRSRFQKPRRDQAGAFREVAGETIVRTLGCSHNVSRTARECRAKYPRRRLPWASRGEGKYWAVASRKLPPPR